MGLFAVSAVQMGWPQFSWVLHIYSPTEGKVHSDSRSGSLSALFCCSLPKPSLHLVFHPDTHVDFHSQGLRLSRSSVCLTSAKGKWPILLPDPSMTSLVFIHEAFSTAPPAPLGCLEERLVNAERVSCVPADAMRCVCVCSYLLHTKYQNANSTGKWGHIFWEVRTFWLTS